MRRAFVLFDEAPTKADALDVCPWASVVVKAKGGWWAFESAADYQTWKNQK